MCLAFFVKNNEIWMHLIRVMINVSDTCTRTCKYGYEYVFVSARDVFTCHTCRVVKRVWLIYNNFNTTKHTRLTHLIQTCTPNTWTHTSITSINILNFYRYNQNYNEWTPGTWMVQLTGHRTTQLKKKSNLEWQSL
jgi:hypothetical protein